MGQKEKSALRRMVTRCKDVIYGEIDLLDDWSKDPALASANQARCLKRKQRIMGCPKVAIDKIDREVSKLPAADVHSSPNAEHESMVDANEQSLTGRRQWDLSEITSKALTRGLDRAEANSKDSVRDAILIVADCT